MRKQKAPICSASSFYQTNAAVHIPRFKESKTPGGEQQLDPPGVEC
jgi:hypothetical protein